MSDNKSMVILILGGLVVFLIGSFTEQYFENQKQQRAHELDERKAREATWSDIEEIEALRAENQKLRAAKGVQ